MCLLLLPCWTVHWVSFASVRVASYTVRANSSTQEDDSLFYMSLNSLPSCHSPSFCACAEEWKQDQTQHSVLEWHAMSSCSQISLVCLMAIESWLKSSIEALILAARDIAITHTRSNWTAWAMHATHIVSNMCEDAETARHFLSQWHPKWFNIYYFECHGLRAVDLPYSGYQNKKDGRGTDSKVKAGAGVQV